MKRYEDEKAYCCMCEGRLCPGWSFKSIGNDIFCSDDCLIEYIDQEYGIKERYIETAEDIADNVGDALYHMMKDEGGLFDEDDSGL